MRARPVITGERDGDNAVVSGDDEITLSRAYETVTARTDRQRAMRSVIVMCPCDIVNGQTLALLCRCFSVSCSALPFVRSFLLSLTRDRMSPALRAKWPIRCSNESVSHDYRRNVTRDASRGRSIGRERCSGEPPFFLFFSS